ncbi:hypothetical protein JCM16161A_08470 [Vulcanisaeta sp. JCM 16161]
MVYFCWPGIWELIERYDYYYDPKTQRVCRFNRFGGKGREFLRHYRALMRLLGGFNGE